MTQSQHSNTEHLGFQLSLLKLWSIPGPNGKPMEQKAAQEARQIENLLEKVSVSSHK